MFPVGRAAGQHDFHFISPCGAKLCEALQLSRCVLLFDTASADEREDDQTDDRDRIGNRRGEVRIESSCRELDAERLRKAEDQTREHTAEAFAGAHSLRRAERRDLPR